MQFFDIFCESLHLFLYLCSQKAANLTKEMSLLKNITSDDSSGRKGFSVCQG